MEDIKTKKIVFENGREFIGKSFGSENNAVFEAVYNTSMVGYQEIVTDASNAEKGIVMTYPIIGNYGIMDEDNESKIPLINALIVREYNDFPSNFRYTKTLGEIMEENKIPGICEIDTREIIRMLRKEGVMKAAVVSEDISKNEAFKMIQDYIPSNDIIKRISCKKCWYSRTFNPLYNVVVIDCGVKNSIIKSLNERSCNITVVPYNTSHDVILSLAPDGLLISNGAGAPEDAGVVIELIKSLKGKIPMMGIGLGYHLIAAAYGCRSYKLKVGFRGENYPVREIYTNKIYTVSKNQSYRIEPESFLKSSLDITYISIPGNETEGIECKNDKIFAVQFHPEGAPGPNDTIELFDRFIELMKGESINA